MNRNNTVRLEDKDSSNLLELLRKSSPYASPEEQNDFENLDIDSLLEDEFEELTFGELI